MKNKPSRICICTGKQGALQARNNTPQEVLEHVNIGLDAPAVRSSLRAAGFARFKAEPLKEFQAAADQLSSAFGTLPPDQHDPTGARRRAYQKYVILPWDGRSVIWATCEVNKMLHS